MSFLSGTDLKSALNDVLGVEFKEQSIKQAAYELALGNEVYCTDSKERKIEILDERNKIVEINAGQFCLLLTKETVRIPPHLMAFISIKSNEKFKGLINVSGFHLDPGFKGQILFSVYNAGPSTISLRKDEPYFLIWLCKLSIKLTEDEAYNSKQNIHQDQSAIPTRYIDALKRGELTSPSALSSKIEKVENDFTNKITKLEVLLGVIVTILLAIGVKTWADLKSEDNGYQKRIKEELLIKEIMNTSKLPVDSNLFKRVDSIVKHEVKSMLKGSPDTTK